MLGCKIYSILGKLFSNLKGKTKSRESLGLSHLMFKTRRFPPIISGTHIRLETAG